MSSAQNWLNDFKSSGAGGASSNNQRLPPGWEQGFDNKSGRIYYFNRQTQQSSWDVPSSDMVIPSQPQQQQRPQREMPAQRGMGMQRDMGMQQGGQSVNRDYTRGNQDSRNDQQAS